MKKHTLSRTLAFIMTLVMIISSMSVGIFAADEEISDVLSVDYATVQQGCVDKKVSCTIEKTEIDGRNVAAVKPMVKDAEATVVNIDGYGFDSKLKVDIREYKFASIEYKYVSERPVEDKMILRIMKNGGILKASTEVPATANLKAGGWNVAYFPIGGAIAAQIAEDGDGILRQIHLYPFGKSDVTVMSENDVIYLGKLSFYKKNPDADAKITIEYTKGNPDAEGIVPEKAGINPGETYTIAECPLTLKNGTFLGWKIVGSDTVYKPGEVITPETDTLLSASWKVEEEKKDLVALVFASYQSGPVDKTPAVKVENIDDENGKIVKIMPQHAEDKIPMVDGWNYTKANINLKNYKYLLINYKYESSAPTETKLKVNLLKSGGILQKSTPCYSLENIKAGEWTTAIVDITAINEQLVEGVEPVLKQMHFYPFGDKKSSELAEGDVMYVSTIVFTNDGGSDGVVTHKAYMNGYSDGTFKPNKTMSRAEACTVVARLLEEEAKISGTASFTDVAADKWYAKYIGFCEAKGLLKSYSGTFAPDQSITRAEFAELVYNTGLAKDTGKEVKFTDVTEAHPRYAAIKAAASAGLITGYADGTFLPDRTITRAQVVTVINRALGREIKAENLSEDVTYTFIDVAPDFWGFANIAEATMNHTELSGNWTHVTTSPADFIKDEPNLNAGAEKAAEVEALAAKRRDEIRAAESDYSTITGKKFYVSADGDDANDGSSPEKAVKTLAAASKLPVRSGDGVLFRRGDIFRGQLTATAGVTYSAYGEGEKPRFYRSPENGADASKWTLMEGTKNIWIYANEDMVDIGVIVFNEGEANTYKEIPDYKNNTYYYRGTDKKFDIIEALDNDLDFFHKADSKTAEGGYPARANGDAGKIYLRCDKGNPGEVFSSIEFAVGNNNIVAKSGCVFDNLCVMYGGSHGIGAGNTNGLTVKNCEFGWIGGSIQSYNQGTERAGTVTRFGNAVEIYGSAKNYTVDNCYVNQVYDAGLTHQSGNGVEMSEIYYTNNVIENCVYSIEYFNGKMANGKSAGSNIVIENNIMRLSGYGFGSQRYNPETPAHIKSWENANEFDNFTVKNNIFDRATHYMFQIVSAYKAYLPEVSGNTYIQTYGAKLMQYGVTKGTNYNYEKTAPAIIKHVLGDSDAKVYFVK